MPVLCYGFWVLSKTGWNILKDAELKYKLFTEKHFVVKSKCFSAENHLSICAHILGMDTTIWGGQGYFGAAYGTWSGLCNPPICCSFNMGNIRETRNPEEFVKKFSVFHRLEGWCGMSELDSRKKLSELRG
jgi:hypothetical protein